MKLGRATILLAFSQMVFLVSSLAVNFGLARLLGVADYGNYGLVMSVLVVVELLVITGFPEVLQKFGGERPEAMGALVRQTLRWQALYTAGVFALFWLAAPFVAKFFRDQALVFFFRLAGVDIVFYGLYKYFLGVQNGLQRFRHHMLLGVTYSLSRLFAILGLVLLNYSLPGALLGNVLASAAALGLALFFYRAPRQPGTQLPVAYGTWVMQNVIYFVGLNALFSIDLWFVKLFLSKSQVGLYVSASVLAKLSYFMSIALSAVLLPGLARALAQHETLRARELAQETLRYLIIFLTLFNVLVFLHAREIIALLFGEEFILAAPFLRWLALGHSLMAIMAVVNTMMIAHNKMRACFVLVLALVALDVALNLYLVPRWHMPGAACATLVVGLAGTIVSVLYIFEEVKPLLFSLFIPRTLGISACVAIFAKLTAAVPVDFIVKAIVAAGAYFLLLWLSKEINTVDLRRLRESLGMSKSI